MWEGPFCVQDGGNAIDAAVATCLCQGVRVFMKHLHNHICVNALNRLKTAQNCPPAGDEPFCLWNWCVGYNRLSGSHERCPPPPQLYEDLACLALATLTTLPLVTLPGSQPLPSSSLHVWHCLAPICIFGTA